MSTEYQREYWRLAQKKHRIKQANLEQAAIFKPNITRFERCSIDGKWYPTAAILRTGDIVRFSLDSYHRASGIPQRPLKLPKDVPKTEIDSINSREFEICVDSRMLLYHESENIARANCSLVLEDPLYRHFPPGLIQDPQGRYHVTDAVPIEINSEPWLFGDPIIHALRKCFKEKMKKHMKPEKAVKECMDSIKQVETDNLTVGDLFGKSRAEIAAMTRKPDDPNLTVGNLFGKTTEQILREQRHGWNQNESEAFEKCVIDQMKEGKTRDEAEKLCEALSATSTDKKLKADGSIYGTPLI